MQEQVSSDILFNFSCMRTIVSICVSIFISLKLLFLQGWHFNTSEEFIKSPELWKSDQISLWAQTSLKCTNCFKNSPFPMYLFLSVFFSQKLLKTSQSMRFPRMEKGINLWIGMDFCPSPNVILHTQFPHDLWDFWRVKTFQKEKKILSSFTHPQVLSICCGP